MILVESKFEFAGIPGSNSLKALGASCSRLVDIIPQAQA